jgi:hypothetical protein
MEGGTLTAGLCTTSVTGEDARTFPAGIATDVGPALLDKATIKAFFPVTADK